MLHGLLRLGVDELQATFPLRCCLGDEARMIQLADNQVLIGTHDSTDLKSTEKFFLLSVGRRPLSSSEHLLRRFIVLLRLLPQRLVLEQIVGDLPVIEQGTFFDHFLARLGIQI